MAKQKNAALNFMTSPGMSKFKEQFTEYLFLKDLMLQAASKNTPVVVSRSDFDTFGFDLLLSKRDDKGEWESVRVQLKSTFQHRSWDVHKSLLNDKEGRIVVIELSAQSEDILPKYYLFNRKHAATALARSPKVEHSGKCAVKLVGEEFVLINNDLLSLFAK